jgi:glyoxylase-like metal-dependent hydrolase (beta-lactamase superfamily II)
MLMEFGVGRASMRTIADRVWQLTGFPRDMFNVYLAEDILIDTGTRYAKRRILRQLRGQTINLVALTHCHPDHQGTAKVMCTRFGVPLACHAADVPAMEGRVPMQPDNRLVRFVQRYFAGPPYPVERVLQDGEALAGFSVIHAPGHSPGHVIFFRERDRLAIAGDLIANIHFLTGRTGLREPPAYASTDKAQNRRSMQLLLDLNPVIVCLGHGPPVTDMDLLRDFVASRR